MDMRLNFDYFYEDESEQFSFYRIPKVLITDPRFSSLSTDAKLLYGLMLDRMELSRKNQWLDDYGRVYIYFTVDEVMESLNCGREKAVKIMAELDEEKGVGLTQKVRQGLGKPTIIYVMNFVTRDSREKNFDSEFENRTSRSRKTELQEVGKSNFKKSGNRTSGSREIELQEIGKPNFRKSGNQTSRGRKTELQGVRKPEGKDNKSNYNESSNIQSIYLSEDGEIGEWEDLIKDNIRYEILWRDYGVSKELLDELLSIMVETIAFKREQIKVGDMIYPYDFVKKKLLKLDSSHMQYVARAIEENTTKVTNIKSYLLACLLNAPSTIDSYYTMTVHHDMYEYARNKAST